MNGMYEELIEKLRKNNRMSGWTHIDRLIDEAAEAIEALQAENERLADETIKLMKENAQNSMRVKSLTADKDEQAGQLMRYDAVLKQAKEALQEAWDDDGSIAVGNRILETIKAIDALLGSSLSTVVHLVECGLELIEMVETLQQENEQLQMQVARMREALEYYADIKRWGEVNLIYVPSPDKAREALAEIDKVLGGKDDA